MPLIRTREELERQERGYLAPFAVCSDSVGPDGREYLEQRYEQFPGLNLTLHTLAGMEKHDTPYDRTDSKQFQPGLGPSLEAQVASLADEIAYHSHDVEDSLVTGVLSVEEWNASGVRL